MVNCVTQEFYCKGAVIIYVEGGGREKRRGGGVQGYFRLAVGRGG